MSSEASTADLDVFELLDLFKRNVVVKDRKYRLTTYKQVFIGSEAVQWLVTSGTAQTRDDAVRIGQLLQDAGFIEHCLREHDFKDEYKFYRFILQTDRGAVPLKNNRAVSWGDFLAPVADSPGVGNLTPKLPSTDFEPSSTNAHIASAVYPMDESNIKLLDNVHPPEWIDPEFSGVYNLVVIGAGAGGLVSAAGAAGAGAKVALVEAHLLGGDCLNVGCVPSKALIHAANLAHTVRNKVDLEESGILLEGDVKVNFAQTMRRIRGIRAEISENDSANRFTKKLGVDVYFGFAKFLSEKSVMVNDKILEFKKCVIATGGHPNIPDIPGLRTLHSEGEERANSNEPLPYVLTNETFFNMTEQPRTMGVIGTGVIGMELGQAMQRLGTQVTMFGRSGAVLPKEDADLADTVKTQMEMDGVKFRLNVAEYKRCDKTGSVSENGYPELLLTTIEDGQVCEYPFDAILVSAGRKPNVTGMDLEKAKVDYDLQRGLRVNDMLQTSNSRIYGVGDVCSDFKFTHVADFQARMVIRNALFLGSNKTSSLLIPYCTFTQPELAHVGLYESDLRDRGIQFKTFEKHFSDNDRAICDGTTTGMVRLHVEAKGDKILGASILGVDAGNMISEITMAMQCNVGLGKIATIITPYPSLSDSIRLAGDLYNKTRLTPAVRGLLRSVINLQR